MNQKEIRKELAKDLAKQAELQESIALKESLLPEKASYKAKNEYSMVYDEKFKEVIDALSPAERSVMWHVKEQFDKHPALKSDKTEVRMTAKSIGLILSEQGMEIHIDTLRKAMKKLVHLGFIKPLSESKDAGARSTYRMNPFIATGKFSEPIGKLQAEWMRLFGDS